MLTRLIAVGALVTSAVVPVTAGLTASTAAEPGPGPAARIDEARHTVRLPAPGRSSAKTAYDPHTVLVRFKPGVSSTGRTAALRSRDAVATASIGKHVKVHTDGPATDLLQKLRKDPSVQSVSLNYGREKEATPNDPEYAQGFQNYLKTLRLPASWDLHKTGVPIAVLDTGFDIGHEDYAGRLGENFDAVVPGRPMYDFDGHGTMVAGMAAAATNNGLGIAGAAWSGKVLPVKVFQTDGFAYDSEIAVGIEWAVSHGAKVINLSLGSDAPSTAVLHDAIVAAVSAGVVVVAAAGNTGKGEPHYPGSYPEVLAVGATDHNGALTDFSTWGDWVDVVAPGFDIEGPYPDPDPAPPVEHDWYATGAGTSFSSPLVAGIVSMVRSKYSSLTPAQVMARIEATARDGGPRGVDPYYGHGFVDAAAALGGPSGGELLPIAVPSAGNNDMPARAVALSVPLSRTLGEAGDVDWYRYEATADKAVQIAVKPTTLDGTFSHNLDPTIAVYDKDLRLLKRTDSPITTVTEALNVSVTTGPVYIAVGNANGAYDPRYYTVSVSNVSSATNQPGEQLWVRDASPGINGLPNSLSVAPTVTFQRELDPVSVDDTTVYLLDAETGQKMPASTSYNESTRVATITPVTALQDLGAYRIVVGAVRDTGGATHTDAFSVPFRADPKPGVVGGFDATGWYQSATLHWSLPAGSDLSQVIVRGGTSTAPPASPTQGFAVYTGVATSAASPTLSWGMNYSFRAWTKDRAGQLSPTYTETKLAGTRLSIARSATELTYGGSVTVTGKITRADTGAAVPGAGVRLYARQKGHTTWRLLRTATATSAGALSLVYKPTAGNDFQWRWYSGSTELVGSGSGIVSTGVRVAVTAGVSRTTAPLGTAVAVSGSVSPKHAGQLVYLQRYRGNNVWANETSMKLSSTSVYSFHPKPAARGTYYYRVVRPADTDHLLGVSPTRSFRVT